MSFFLWSSIPDDELLEAAVDGQLGDPAELERQTRRLLADARSKALVDNFASQWLRLRNLESQERESADYPEFDENCARRSGARPSCSSRAPSARTGASSSC